MKIPYHCLLYRTCSRHFIKIYCVIQKLIIKNEEKKIFPLKGEPEEDYITEEIKEKFKRKLKTIYYTLLQSKKKKKKTKTKF